MQRSVLGSALMASALVLAVPAFAQTSSSTAPTHTGTTATHPAHPMHHKVAPTNTVATKQHTQSDPTNTYLFKPGSGDYSSRAAQKQRTDGEDVTGNNNFPAASK
jgi:cell division septation protein DedD